MSEAREQVPVLAAPATATSLIAVRVGETEFGLPIAEVEEVLDPPEITRLPVSAPAILGVVSVRGTIVPVLDLGVRLFGRPVQDAARLVVVRDRRTAEPVGLLVDAVVGIVAVPEAGPEPAPAEAASPLPEGAVAGVVAEGDRLITVLNLKPVLALAGTEKES